MSLTQTLTEESAAPTSFAIRRSVQPRSRSAVALARAPSLREGMRTHVRISHGLKRCWSRSLGSHHAASGAAIRAHRPDFEAGVRFATAAGQTPQALHPLSPLRHQVPAGGAWPRNLFQFPLEPGLPIFP